MKHKGFTVLEFLIVVTIISILVGLILVGLNAARSNARDQKKIADLQRIALGIQQYHDICREYPASLDTGQTCDNLGGSAIESIIADLKNYEFNTGGDYHYTAIADDVKNPDTCSSFHLWVQLEKERNTNAARFDSVNQNNTVTCTLSTNPSPVDASMDQTIYDIHK